MKIRPWHFALITLPMACAAAMATQPAVAASASEAQAADLQAEQERLLEQLKEQLKSLPSNDPNRGKKADQVAAIEKRIREGSRVQYVSPVSRGHWKAYDTAVTRRVEQQGEQHFPTVDGQKLYGRLVVNLTIDGDGDVVGVEVVHGSGNSTLDQLAVKIAIDAGPFPPFDAAMRRDADRVVITSPFNFRHQN